MVNSKKTSSLIIRLRKKIGVKFQKIKGRLRNVKQSLSKKSEPVSKEVVSSTSKKVTSSKPKKRTVVLGFGVLAAIFVAIVTVKTSSAEKMPAISSKILAFFETAKQTLLKQPKAKELAPKRLTLPGNSASTNQVLFGRLLIVIALVMDPYGGIVGLSLGMIGLMFQRFLK